jgi:DNA polymerase-1
MPPKTVGRPPKVDRPPREKKGPRVVVDPTPILPPVPDGWHPDPLPESLPSTLGFDVETDGLRWWSGHRPIGFSLAWYEGGEIRAVYIPWGHAGGNHDEDTVRRWALRMLRGKRLIGLNLRFDIHMMRVWGVDLEAAGCTAHDVGHAAALLDDHRREFSLDVLAQDILGQGKVDLPFPKDRMAAVHAYHVTEYARVDAGHPLRIDAIQGPALGLEGLETVAALEDDVIWAVCAMEAAGAPIDVPKLERWDAETKKAEEAFRQRCHRAFGFHVNPKTDMERVFRHLRIPNTARTATGRPSFTADVVEAAAAKYPDLAPVRALNHVLGIRSRYIVPYLAAVGPDNIIRYGLNQLRTDDAGTVSGRFSSSKPARERDSGINIQQVMSVEKQEEAYADLDGRWIIRELFVPASGLFLASDAKQIEYRIFAHYANSAALNARYAADPETDFHNVVLEMIQAHKPDFKRKPAKFVNFAKLFGAGIGRVAEMTGTSRVAAQDLVDTYDRAFPEADVMLRLAMKEAKRRGWVRTILGRRARFPDADRIYKALNSVVQGSAADEHKKKMVALHRTRRETGFILRASVHDEFTGDVPDQESARRVDALLNEPAIPFRIPILWETNTGPHWAACK